MRLLHLLLPAKSSCTGDTDFKARLHMQCTPCVPDPWDEGPRHATRIAPLSKPPSVSCCDYKGPTAIRVWAYTQRSRISGIWSAPCRAACFQSDSADAVEYEPAARYVPIAVTVGVTNSTRTWFLVPATWLHLCQRRPSPKMSWCGPTRPCSH